MFIQPLPKKERPLSAATSDLLVVIVASMVVLAVAVQTDLFETLLRGLDETPLPGPQGDELLVLLSFLGFALFIYSFRRQRELRYVIAQLRSVEEVVRQSE